MSSTLEYLADVVKRHSGIQVTAEKHYLFGSRLHPVLRRHKLETVEELAGKIRAGGSRELLSDLIDAMTTNESYFFRDKKPFDDLKTHILPALRSRKIGPNDIRIWSAACSTGQEAYSTCMLLVEEGWTDRGGRIDVVGTDISGFALERATSGEYTHHEVQRGLPAHYLVKYFERADANWRLKEPMRRMARFQHMNLLEPTPLIGRFDVIFCRNVLIYFDVPTKVKVLTQLQQHLTPGGVFCLGGAETPLGLTNLYEAATPSGIWWRVRTKP